MDLSASAQSPEEAAILEAVSDGQLEIVKRYLEGNPNLIWTKAPVTGSTLLQSAIQGGHQDVSAFLLERGANPEVEDNGGWTPLALAAMRLQSSLPLAELLLRYGADVNHAHSGLNQSALHICASEGYIELARILLDRGARVDLSDRDGKTPLFMAVAKGEADMVKLLLQYGATRNVKSNQGETLESLANNNADILLLLRSAQLLRGPKVSKQRRKKAARKDQTIVALVPAPLDDQEKMVACHAFQAGVIDFHIGELEERIERTVSIYDILYGRGTEALMSEARQGKIEGKPTFRWIHLPANNMEWVQTLVRRHFADRNPRIGQYTGALAADLGMRRTNRDHHLMFTSKGSFVRPFCRKVEVPQEGPETKRGHYIAAFVPYLHFEIQKDFKAMSAAVSKAIETWAFRPPPTRSRAAPANIANSRSGSGSLHGTDESRRSVSSGGYEASAEASGMLNQILIQGYLKPGRGGEVPPLQIRRTLDHYFYSHLASTARRDGDQVVQRYTSEFIGVEPKMFMVDQLWLWVLDDDTVISCCPLRWDSWTVGPGPPTSTQSGPEGPTTWRDFMLRANDPLSIHQSITEYLKKVRRESVADAEDLCRLITSACLNAFDHYATPDEFHFFDFVEHAIGQVMDRTAERFEEFRILLDASAASNQLLPATNIKIEQETKLLGEIEDIRDELGILRLVLEDQKRVTEELDGILNDLAPIDDKQPGAFGSKAHALKGNRVLDNHLSRIDRMESLAKRSIQSIRSLLKLKQQHASLSEAHSARKQAEYTSRQTRVATEYNKNIAEQLSLAQKQAQETAKQGNVILLFTVVTVVFLPLSFMTSFFTIELDAFPYNDDGKMPLPTILGIILAVSAGVSIPFILVAFNFERLIKWSRLIVKRSRAASLVTSLMVSVIVVLIIALGVVLSQPLEAGIKAGIGIGLGLLAAMAVTTIFVSNWVR